MVYKQKVNSYKLSFSLAVFICGMISVFLSLILVNEEKRVIALLPLSYMVLYALLKSNRKFLNNISLSIINISAFCRYIIYPIIIAINFSNGGSYSFDTKVVYFLVYELIGVFIVIGLFAKKLNISNHVELALDKHLGIPNLFLLVILLPIVLLFPTLLTQFSISPDVIKSASVSGIVVVLFNMGVWVLFVYLLVKLSSLKDNSKFTNWFGFVLATLVGVYYILFNSISGYDVKRWQIISCGIAMVYILIKVFPARKQIVIIGGAIGIVSAVLLGSIIKFGLFVSSVRFIDKFFAIEHFTEYFGGMKNITRALQIFNATPKAQGINSTLTDLFSGAPVISAFFDFDSYSTVSIFQSATHRSDIICPMTAQSIVHFGVIGTPVLAMIMTYLSIVFNAALRKTSNLYSAYVLIEMVVFTSLFMELNTTIILGKIWIRLMFLVLQFIENRTKIQFKI